MRGEVNPAKHTLSSAGSKLLREHRGPFQQGRCFTSESFPQLCRVDVKETPDPDYSLLCIQAEEEERGKVPGKLRGEEVPVSESMIPSVGSRTLGGSLNNVRVSRWSGSINYSLNTFNLLLTNESPVTSQ